MAYNQNLYQTTKAATTSTLVSKIQAALGAEKESYEARLALHEMRSRLLEAQAGLRALGYIKRRRGGEDASED